MDEENPWKEYETKWPGAMKWVLDNPQPSAFCRLDYDTKKGFRWLDNLCRMKNKEYTATLFVKECPKPTKRAKLIRKDKGVWQWRCPAHDEHFFNDPAPSTSILDYLEIKTGDHEVVVPQTPIDAWNTTDFYLDGNGYFIHNDCDKETGTTIRYVLLKNGKWDIVSKVKVSLFNRRGKAIKRITVDVEKWLNLYPSSDRRQYCTPKMLPVWLPRSFISTQPEWTEDDNDTIQDLFYLIVGYTTPYKARVLQIVQGPIHTWPDVSKDYPDLIADMETEAQDTAKKVLNDYGVRDMVDGHETAAERRTKKIVKFITQFINAAATTVAMVVTLMKVWDDMF